MHVDVREIYNSRTSKVGIDQHGYAVFGNPIYNSRNSKVGIDPNLVAKIAKNSDSAHYTRGKIDFFLPPFSSIFISC